MLLLILAVAFSSCRKLIRDEFPYMEPKPVVNAIIRDGVPISVHVSLSGQLDTMPLNAVENAVVNLFVDGVFAEQLTHRSPDSARYYDYDNLENGHYTSTLFAQQGKHYSLEVSVPGVSNVHCETYLPHSERILDVQYLKNAGVDQDGLRCPALKITFSNNPNEVQYFQMSINMFSLRFHHRRDTINDTLIWRTWEEYGPYSSYELTNLSDPVILGEGLPITVFSNRMIKGDSYTMYLEFTIYGGMIINGERELPPVVVELRSISPAYYHYLRSYYLYERNLEMNDIGAIYPPHQLYSNIDGGYGIFGSYSSFVSDTIKP